MAKTSKLDALKKAFAEADNSNDHYTEYKVSDTDQVRCALKFGTSGVSVNTTISLMGDFLVENADGDIKDQPVGCGADILGESLVVYSTLTKTAAMGESNTVRVDFSLTGGAEDYAHSLSQTVSEENPSVIFRIDVLFIG